MESLVTFGKHFVHVDGKTVVAPDEEGRFEPTGPNFKPI